MIARLLGGGKVRRHTGVWKRYALRLLWWRIATAAMHYNFARIHKTLRTAPAVSAGLSDQVLSLEEIVLPADR